MGELFDFKLLKMLKRILRNQQTIYDKLEDMEDNTMTILEELQAQVLETLAAANAAIVRLQELTAQITTLVDELEEAGIDENVLASLRDQLDASEQALLAAVQPVPPVEP